MDWITGMQKAIDYIEDNIMEELDYKEIAKQAYISSFYFQRVFGILSGLTVGEYIRNRRLTLAGIELSHSYVKVIDIAFKYGYETPESFKRAFTRFHGITPSYAREKGANLKSFSRLSIQLSLKGGNIMDYRIEEKEAFKVIAKTERFSKDYDLNRKDIPKFWERCHADGTILKLYELTSEPTEYGRAVLGICEDICDEDKDFAYSIGAKYCKGIIPKGFIIKEIPSYTWVIFKCVGAIPQAIQELWHRIYTEFFPTSEFKPIECIEFDVYFDGDISSNNYVSEIWIPVEKR